MTDVPRVRYFVIDSTTGLTFHNFFSEESAREAVARMGGDYHLGKEFVDDENLPAPFKEEEYHG
jgi:hypothetical protein